MIEKWKHPELKKEEEIFIGNFTRDQLPGIGWKTKRMGNVAYTVSYLPIINKGNELDLYPVFIQKKEVEEEMELCQDEKDCIGIYENMLKRNL